MTIPVTVVLTQLASSKQSSNLSMYMPKRVGDKGQPCLTPILQLIYFNQPSVFLNLEITFSYSLIASSLNSKGTFISSNLFQRFFLGTMSNAFLNSTKQQKRLVLVLQNSSAMILKVTILPTIAWYLLNSAWTLALLPWLSIQRLIFFSKIIHKAWLK